MLLAEDLLLLLTDDSTGRLLVSGAEMDIALAGAQLVELSLAGRVDIDGSKRLVVLDGSPTGDAVLDRALEIVARREGKKPSAVMGELGRGIRPTLYERLAASGVLRREEGTMLGVFPIRRWPTASADHEAAVRRALTAALVQGATPQPRDGALVALLHALRATHKVVVPKEHGLRRRELHARAKEVSQGSWGSDAVRQAVDAMMAAVIGAASVAAVAGSGGS
ncbi:MAG TPA: GPP34 family phosphoprotein [Nocardioidaceae bacterium]|nr:GPP34 family phosphoprotein [Nocardioidaceae bacterium]